MSSYNIDTDFEFLNNNKAFPSESLLERNAKYRLNEKRYTGKYGSGVYLVQTDQSGRQRRYEWKTLKINKYKTYTNKIDGLVFNSDPIIKTGNLETDKIVNKLIDKTGWLKNIRQAYKYLEIYGDVYLKTYRYGVSAIKPYHCFTVVDDKDTNKVLGHVLVDYLINNDKVEAIRFEIHLINKVYEIVYSYNGKTLGKPIRYKYKNRTIPVSGILYNTGLDVNMIQHLKIDSIDGVYGQSPYEDFCDLVSEAEKRQTLMINVLDAHAAPTVAVAMGTLKENEQTGQVESDVLGSVIEVPNGGQVPQYITWDGKLDSSKEMLETLFSEIYEATELSKTLMTSEYQGNISEESLNTLISGAIAKGNRHIFDIWYDIIQSLYVLCRLNNIKVNIEDLSISFGIGNDASNKDIADIINSRVTNKTLSLETALVQYSGLTSEQAKLEIDKIKKERELYE